MDFRILGPLEVWDGGRPLELRRQKQRALLADLLLHAGQAVSVDRLIDDLWGERPPPTARGSLQNMVSGLRKVLGRKVLRTESAGYLLAVERDQVDLFRFERLLEEARNAAGADERVETLRQALAFWRGRALADLAFEPFALLESPRLEELHLAAREELIDARLALGEHAGLIAEVELLIAEHPFDERLRGQLMLALYCAGRQADALDAYREARRFLLEELGLEPSAVLGELEQAILRQDPALAAPPRRLAGLLPMRKTATVLYAEFVDSDGRPMTSDPEVLAQLLSRYATAAHRALERHGGTAEILGSGPVLAVFGIPQAHEDDALRTLRAATELCDDLRELGGELQPRIGISTGKIFAGGTTPTALVTGGAVEDAKRLETAAAAGEILLSAPTLRLVRDAVVVDPLELPLDGERRHAAWRLRELIHAAPAIPRRFEAPLVGRGRELAEIRRVFDSVLSEQSCRLVVVVGEPGVGKTRFAREFRDEVGREATFLVGRCVSYGDGASLLPVRDILRDLGTETSDALSSLLADEEDGELVAQRIAGAAGLADEPAPREETNWAFRRLFETLAARRPLVLAFEDAHWAEPTLLDLIEHLRERASGPMLALCLTRPELLESRAEWAQHALTLAPLAEREVGMLVDSLHTGFASGARARVIELAEGNPLFAEQLVAHAEEEGSEGLEAAPPSIEALLASRLDLLPAGERAFLERAAVFGRRFPHAGVIAISATDPAMPEQRLQSLMRKGFIRSGAIEDPLSFHHVLVRTVAYAGVAKSVRAELHERAAEWHGRHDAADEIVGYHLEQAALYKRELGQPDHGLSESAARAARRRRTTSPFGRRRPCRRVATLAGARTDTSRSARRPRRARPLAGTLVDQPRCGGGRRRGGRPRRRSRRRSRRGARACRRRALSDVGR
jgi:DNA-binding SARP family transcriptional activator